jgi:hypothetical protein
MKKPVNLMYLQKCQEGMSVGNLVICESCVNCKVYGFTRRAMHQKICLIATKDRWWLLTSEFGFQTSEIRVRISDFRVQTSDFRLQSSEFRLRISDFGFQTSDFRVQTSEFGFQTSEFRLRIFNVEFCLKPMLGGVDGNLHFPVPSMNRLN